MIDVPKRGTGRGSYYWGKPEARTKEEIRAVLEAAGLREIAKPLVERCIRKGYISAPATLK